MIGNRPVEERWRLFVAVPIGDQLRAKLAELVSEWRAEDAAPDLRWTDAAGWHLTLAFLGSTPTHHLPALRRRLDAVAVATPAFRISTGGLGAFPRPARARVLWYGIGEEDERLASLAGAVGDAVGVHEARPFHAHLTLARARVETGVALEQWLRSHDAPGGEIAVQELILFRSHLGRGPAQYEAIVRFPLVELASAGRAAERGAQHG